MAKKIKDTPTLTGIDSIKFHKAILENNDKCISLHELKKLIESYKRISKHD